MKKSKIYPKVAIFKAPSEQDATKILYNIFDNRNVIRSTYMIETDRGVTLVVHHEGWSFDE